MRDVIETESRLSCEECGIENVKVVYVDDIQDMPEFCPFCGEPAEVELWNLDLDGAADR